MSQRERPKQSRAERKKEETKLKIVSTAISLFKQQGIDGTTMEQIADEADIAKGTLYNYFPVKEAILNEFIQRSFREKNPQRIQQLRKLPNTRLRMIMIISMLFEGIQENMEIFEKYIVYRIKNMISFHPEESEKAGIGVLAAEIIELGQKGGEIRTDLPPNVLEDLFEFVFIEVVKQYTLQKESFKSRDVIEQFVDLFINGVKAESN